MPGVPQGVPPDLVKGYQPPPGAGGTAAGGRGAKPSRSRSRNPRAEDRPPGQRRASTPPSSRRAAAAGRTSSGSAGRRRASRQPQQQQQSHGRPPQQPGAQSAWPPPTGAARASRRVQWPIRRRRADCVAAPGRGIERLTQRTGPVHELHARHRRTAECRQVDAVQPAGRQAPRAGR